MQEYPARPIAKKPAKLNPSAAGADLRHSKFQSINIAYPWAIVDVPAYKVGRHGRWLVKETPENVSPGFYLPREKNDKGYALFRLERGRWPRSPWMSFTAMEKQSHMAHIHSAKGSCLCVGLGMGMYLYNIIQKKEVSKIVVIEKDPDVISLFYKVAEPEKWPCWEKVEIVNHDVFDMPKFVREPLLGFDHMFIDIWKRMFDENAYLQSAQLFDLFQPKSIGWWTMEGDFSSWAFRRLNEDKAQFNRETLDAMYVAWARHIAMPVVCQDVERMGSLCAAAMSAACAQSAARDNNPTLAGQINLRTLYLLGAYRGVIPNVAMPV